MSWTDDRVDTLKKLWAEGLSASQIAARLGGVSRNAVIGKVHRLGLSGRATTSRSKPSRPRSRIGTIRRPPKPRFQNGNPALRALYQIEGDGYTAPPEDLDIAIEDRVKLIDLEECSCRWPIGDPQTAEFGFCNRKKAPGLNYCEVHARRAFQPPQSRKRSGTGQPAPQETPAIAADEAASKPAETTADAAAPAQAPAEKTAEPVT
ncbi:MAG: GcrA family cell cycle regulator [Pseudomonadota bacterium]